MDSNMKYELNKKRWAELTNIIEHIDRDVNSLETRVSLMNNSIDDLFDKQLIDTLSEDQYSALVKSLMMEHSKIVMIRNNVFDVEAAMREACCDK